MKVINVTIEGMKPILLHNAAAMVLGSKTPGKKYIPTPQEEAEAGCYWNEDKSSLVLPSENIFRCIIKTARAFKVGKMSAATVIAGNLDFDPFLVPFNTTKYEIDVRRVVVQSSGIMRARPKVWPWSLSFTMAPGDDMPIAAQDTLRAILEEGGRRVGLGDFRPEKLGPFGRFKVAGWEVVEL